MPKELFPSSYLCDCGHQSDFFENTIREAKAMSHKRMIHLGDSAPNEHTIVFYKGRMIDILCPEQAPDAHTSPDRDSTQVVRRPNPFCSRIPTLSWRTFGRRCPMPAFWLTSKSQAHRIIWEGIRGQK
jgi:hypothetical protein